MNTQRYPILRRTVLVATLACSCVLTSGAFAADLIKVRLAQNLSPISGVVIVAKNKQFFEKSGLDVTVINFTSGKQALETTLGGGADIATTAEAPVTASAMAKQPIALLARMEYSYLKTLVSTASGINSLADLKGKRIGQTVGTGSEVYTMALLKKTGISQKDVSTVSLRPQDMVAGLAANGVDVIDTWEPHIANAKKALGSKVKELDTKGIYAETFNIVTTQSYLQSNRDATTKFIKAMLEAEKWMRVNRDEAITTVASAVSMNRDDLALIWDEYVFGVTLDNMTLDVLKTHSSWRLATGNAPSGATMPDFSKVIFTEPLKSVAPDRVKITFN
ncbi:ABC transporter substrate-binding protein [Noviherbaspirillum sp. Root189]|uniref:ABC transporter substrate-binding protein n=1 Tax=Noviherbaspirillum sp. Root189 TaxID=1736487 RepID=UPI0007089152|nr:NrtA/SsuA/CpmA family ABC transporter substrate-binding protein [Noviherbaspirillum sp. Root189]KRB74237.1 ABC transporter substrate-binding protein [Noviherbaspirillum sp. Root189]